jgi:hypothetical protein
MRPRHRFAFSNFMGPLLRILPPPAGRTRLCRATWDSGGRWIFWRPGFVLTSFSCPYILRDGDGNSNVNRGESFTLRRPLRRRTKSNREKSRAGLASVPQMS